MTQQSAGMPAFGALQHRFATLSTAHVADGCIRAGVEVRCSPAGTHALQRQERVFGRVRPARHCGSVDVFLEAIDKSTPGEVLVVDNGGRLDEACVGDLIVREAQAAGLAGIVIWGLHRDSAEIQSIGLPVFSLGSIPTGPLHMRARHEDALVSADIGGFTVTAADLVFGDSDGVLFIADTELDSVLAHAERIRDTEQRQARLLDEGLTLREQLDVAGYVDRRTTLPTLTFREHLRSLNASIEE